MTKDKHPLSQQEFDTIYSKVPRLTVEVIIKNDNKIFLTQRAIEPCKDKWHLPGGTVRFGEPILTAVKRIAKRELSITVLHAKNVGYIEYPSHYTNGLDCPFGIVFEVTEFSGVLSHNNEAVNGAWFSMLPSNIHEEQDIFLLQNNYLTP